MPLTETEVKNIAYLARIAIKKEQIPEYQQQLSKILDWVAQLQNIPTENTEPLAHPLEQTQSLRADDITEQDFRNDYQKSAPLTEAGLYLVPRVLE